MAHKVLFSLEMAPLGNSGIPTETRVLFNTLAHRGDVDLTGLLFENADRKTHFLSPRPKRPADREIHASYFLHVLSGGNPPFPISPMAGRIKDVDATIRIFRGDAFGTAPIPEKTFDDVLWRLLFAASVPPQDRATVTGKPFLYTNMTFWDVVASVTLPFAPRPRMRLDGSYDFVVFQDARPIEVSPGATRIIRYHDAIPITHPDLIGDSRYSSVHDACVRRTIGTAHFVCNSTATRDALVTLFPKAEKMAHVIPCVVNANIAPEALIIPAHDVIRTRRMSTVKGGQAPAANPGAAAGDGPAPQFEAKGDLASKKPYLLAVTTLEPKKNVESIVRAWERVRFRNDKAIDLVIVGKPGWRYASILEAMAPHVRSGALHHLQNVPLVELQALYRGAEAVLFPSYAEGFGLPTIEALAAGTPPIVSDIPAHRYVLGEAALFVDPYDVQAIAEAIESLVIAEDRETLRRRILDRAPAVVDRYRPERVGGEWAELFDRLAAQKPRR